MLRPGLGRCRRDYILQKRAERNKVSRERIHALSCISLSTLLSPSLFLIILRLAFVAASALIQKPAPGCTRSSVFWRYFNTLCAMKQHIFLAVAALARTAVSQQYGYDERTTKDCVAWADVKDASVDTCEKSLRYWNVEPKRFHAWNPLVGLDCKPWFNYMSYCIMTQAMLEDSVNYTTTTISEQGGYEYTLPLISMTTDADGWTIPVTRSDAPARTTSTIAPIASPSTWKEMGCYINNFNDGSNGKDFVWEWALTFRYVPRDPEETVDKCKEKCYHVQYKMAGLKDGTECWCGDQVNTTVSTLAENQNDCNTPCGGDPKVICGGTQRMNVFAAQGSAGNSIGTGTAATASTTNSGSAGPTTTASSGARRNAEIFWRW